MSTSIDDADAPIEAMFRAHRQRMLQLALRILSDFGDAEDAVQEAFGRLARADPATLRDPEGWLVVVTSRLCFDRLRSRRRHPTAHAQSAIEHHQTGGPDAADHLTLVENVTRSMHVVLERLSPAERTAFVLHDVFQLPFDEIGEVVGRSAAACRQLASRARRMVRSADEGRRFRVEDNVQREIAERFVAACTDGDLAGLLAVLHPCVDGTADVIGDALTGAEVVAPAILRYLGPTLAPTLLHIPVDGRVGILAMHDHRLLAMVVLTVHDTRIIHVEALTAPASRAAVGAAIGLV
jgi:RNA polymerase sigma-70 factor (ECF subfamily)